MYLKLTSYLAFVANTLFWNFMMFYQVLLGSKKEKTIHKDNV